MLDIMLDPDAVYSRETGDFIGTAVYSDGRDHYRVTPYGRRPCTRTYFTEAVDYLNDLYDATH
jgi:hypothetical protein